MKKILTVITTIALLASLSSLTGCVYTEKTSDGGNSQTSETSTDNNSQNPNNSENSETSSDNDSQNSETSSGNNSENSQTEPEGTPKLTDGEYRSTDEGFSELLAQFTMPDMELPNGDIVKNSDADFVKVIGGRISYIGFDSVHMCKAKPYFRNTIDEPDMIDWDTLEVKNDPGEFTDNEYFKVKAGDKLDNGLTVKSAVFWYGGAIMYEHYLGISFDGEITLEGILYRTPEDEYGSMKGDLHFFPDASKNDFYSPFRLYRTVPVVFADTVNKFALNYSTEDIRLGNETEAPSNVSEILGDNVCAKVRITISDLSFKSTNAGAIPEAVIKDAVKL